MCEPQAEQISTPDKPDSIEKGILLEYKRKLIHACKIREDLGCGITRCGYSFLVGNTGYRPDATFGEPPREDSDKSWVKCKTCCERTDYEAVGRFWRGWKATVRRTLETLGL